MADKPDVKSQDRENKAKDESSPSPSSSNEAPGDAPPGDSPSGDAPTAETQTQSASKNGNLILPDQILPPNLFILPTNSPIVFPTLLAPILVSHPRFVSMIEEAIN